MSSLLHHRSNRVVGDNFLFHRMDIDQFRTTNKGAFRRSRRERSRLIGFLLLAVVMSTTNLRDYIAEKVCSLNMKETSSTEIGIRRARTKAVHGAKTTSFDGERHYSEAAENIVKEKRWAVMMLGGARTYAFARESFRQNVQQMTDTPMDIFAYTFKSSEDNGCLMESFSELMLYQDSTLFHLDKNMPKYKHSRDITSDRFLRQQTEHLQLIDDHATQHNLTYSYILYTRPDLIYALPFRMKHLEQELDQKPDYVFSPKCCAYFGLCDRLSAASYHTFRRMIQISPEWRRVDTKTVYENAFRRRLLFANLSDFDMPKGFYGFATLRVKYLLNLCKHNDRVTKRAKVDRVDFSCYRKHVIKEESATFEAIKSLNDDLQHGSCDIVINSICSIV